MNKLTKRESEVIALRKSGMTLEEIGQKYNVTRERIMLIEKSAREKMTATK